jgi:hypothetical protein
MRIFLRKIRSTVAASVYTNPENALAATRFTSTAVINEAIAFEQSRRQTDTDFFVVERLSAVNLRPALFRFDQKLSAVIKHEVDVLHAGS